MIVKVQLWPWPFDPKMYIYLPLTILHLCMKYESCMLKTTQVIVSEVLTDGQTTPTLTGHRLVEDPTNDMSNVDHTDSVIKVIVID